MNDTKKFFSVQISEELSRHIVVEAKDKDEAFDKAEELWYDQKVILDSSNFVDHYTCVKDIVPNEKMKNYDDDDIFDDDRCL